MIKHIKLECFKRISDFDTDLDNINVLVGTNNSGKSSVLQGIHFTIMSEVIRRNIDKVTIPQDKLLYLPSADFTVLRHDSPYTNSSGSTSSLSLLSDSETAGVPDEFQITLSKGKNYGNISVRTTGNNKFRQQVTSYKDLFSVYTPGLAGISLSEKLVSPAVLRNAAANGDANLYLRNIIYYVKEKGKLDNLNKLIHTVFPNYYLNVPYDPESEVNITVNVFFDGKTLPLELCGTGILQAIQIMAYSVYFEPKLLLLDEPDEHLHPDNQVLLCNAIKSLVDEMDLQVILSTHSRHMISALNDEARFIWMKAGTICKEEQSPDFYNVLLDLGALDSYDAILQGKYTTVILTEDSDTRYLKKILETIGCDLSKILILPFNGCSHLDAAMHLANFIKNSAKSCKVIIHRDRDFMTDDEIAIIKSRFDAESLTLWITDECDIEAYFSTVDHIALITGKTKEEVATWQNEIILKNTVRITREFGTKRDYIQKSMYLNGKLKNNETVKFPDFYSLYGKDPIVSHNKIVGKTLLSLCNANMNSLIDKPISLLEKSEALKIQSLIDLLA